MSVHNYMENKEVYAQTRQWLVNLLRNFGQVLATDIPALSSQPTALGVAIKMDHRTFDLSVTSANHPNKNSKEQILSVTIGKTGLQTVCGLGIPFTTHASNLATLQMWAPDHDKISEQAFRERFANSVMWVLKPHIERDMPFTTVTNIAMKKAIAAINAEKPASAAIIQLRAFTA